MKQITVVRYDAFADAPGMGNPCGIIFDAADLTKEEMQAVAHKSGFTECAFLCPSETADLRLRYFMPGTETPLCGHGTVCAISALMERQEKPDHPVSLKVETLAGVLNIGYDPANGQVVMEQAPAKFEPFTGDLDAVLAAIGLDASAVDKRWPVMYGSTGSWTLILPIANLDDFQKMKPQNKIFASLLTAHPDASIHPICIDTLRTGCTLHGRHFSSTSSGSVEDPVTGTACGVMGAYYLNHMTDLHKPTDHVDILIEQGQDMCRDGLVRAGARNVDGQTLVKIGGTAVPGEVFTVEL